MTRTDSNAKKIWLKSYPPGVPHEISAPPYRSLRDLAETAFREHADSPAFTNQGTTLRYRDIDRLSRHFAAYLQDTLGLTRGERVAIMLPNLLQYPVVVCAIFRAGLVAAPVNPLYTKRELRHQLRDSGARCIVALENYAATIEEIIADTSIRHVVTTGVGDLLHLPRRIVTNFVVRHVRRMVRPYSLTGSVGFLRALSVGKRCSLRTVQLGFADIAFLQYTGGTTGLPKGAMLSHRNMVFNVLQTSAWQGGAFDDIDSITAITALPLYHSFSLESNLLLVMNLGGENVLITDPRDTRSLVKELARHRFHYITGVNTLFVALLNAAGFAALDFSALRLAVGGGMAVQPAVARQWQRVTGKPIVQGYGLTETSPVATCNPLQGTEFNGSVGLPLPSTEIRICDDNGRDVAPGDVGEICIRGPQVMEGYWHNQAETDSVMWPGGWFRSGDIGRMDADGFVYIEDRRKDMILVSGFNVYPNEIENVVVEMDGVREAAAVGIPDEKSGEAVKLFVVRDDPALTEADILAHCRENLAGYKRPGEIEFVEELPKNTVGKVLRRKLRS